MNDKVSIIIPAFNRKDITRACVESILDGSYFNLIVIICDSGSTDGTNLLFQSNSRVKILNLGADDWWSAAVNRGVEYALKKGTKYVIVINDDISFDSNLVTQLVNKSKAHPRVIISPAQQVLEGEFLGTRYTRFLKRRIHLWKPVYEDHVHVETSNGCCLLIPVEVFKVAGYFDDINCPHLAGDVEFQIRAAKYGFKTYAFPDIIIRQQTATNYFRQLKLSNAFSFKGSPILWSQYLTFGKQLFGGLNNFVMLGFLYHLSYVWAIVKLCVRRENK